MKESEKAGYECEQILQNLHNCMKESGFKVYLGWCNDFKRKYRKCKLAQFELQRREHNEECGIKRSRD